MAVFYVFCFWLCLVCLSARLATTFSNWSYDNGLHHALLTDRIRQFLQSGGIHITTWLKAAALDQIDGNLSQLTVVVFQFLIQVNPGSGQQGSKPTLAQSSFLRRHGISHSSR